MLAVGKKTSILATMTMISVPFLANGAEASRLFAKLPGSSAAKSYQSHLIYVTGFPT